MKPRKSKKAKGASTDPNDPNYSAFAKYAPKRAEEDPAQPDKAVSALANTAPQRLSHSVADGTSARSLASPGDASGEAAGSVQAAPNPNTQARLSGGSRTVHSTFPKPAKSRRASASPAVKPTWKGSTAVLETLDDCVRDAGLSQPQPAVESRGASQEEQTVQESIEDGEQPALDDLGTRFPAQESQSAEHGTTDREDELAQVDPETEHATPRTSSPSLKSRVQTFIEMNQPILEAFGGRNALAGGEHRTNRRPSQAYAGRGGPLTVALMHDFASLRWTAAPPNYNGGDPAIDDHSRILRHPPVGISLWFVEPDCVSLSFPWMKYYNHNRTALQQAPEPIQRVYWATTARLGTVPPWLCALRYHLTPEHFVAEVLSIFPPLM